MRSNRLDEIERILRETPDGATTSGLRQFWENSLAEVKRAHDQGADGLDVAGRIASVVDAIVLSAFSRHGRPKESKGHALVALGGYGRQQMSPQSDVDLLFLFHKEKEKDPDSVTGVLHPLWDLGFDVGHSSRTIRESEQMAREDAQSCTAMMDSRYLAGDRELYEEYEKRLFKKIPRGMVVQLKKQRSAHHENNGSVQLLEPDVKDSPGGLRELHMLEWALKGKAAQTDVEIVRHQYLEDQDIVALERGHRFLWRVRHELHFAAGRRQDVLRHEAQPDIARNLGYKDSDSELAVECFMQEYYVHARVVYHLVELALDRLTRKSRHPSRNKLLELGVTSANGEILIQAGKQYFTEKPLRILSIFALAQSKRLKLSERAQRAIRASLASIDEEFRCSEEARDIFLHILKRKNGVAETVRAMHELGVLGAYLPEFGEITCLVQYDVYHIYTVDEHTLVALEKMESLLAAEKESALRGVLESFERRDLLYLSLLLHDVGKARRQEHISSGIEMTTALLDRLSLPEPDGRLVLFLVEHHQDLVIMSQRRDLDDYRMISEFASLFSNRQGLDALYLISFGDLSAVADEAWNQWQGALLWELYHKTGEQLESGVKTLEEQQHARDLLQEHLSEITPTWPPLKVVAFQEHVQQLLPRYLVAYSREQISTHLDLISRLGDKSAEIAFTEHSTYSEMVVCTQDRAKLLSKICAVLAVHDVNILKADVHTRNDRVALDLFQMVDIGGSGRLPDWKKERICLRLQEIIEDRTSTEALFVNYSPQWDRRKKMQARSPLIEFENQVSDRFTVIDLEVQDNVGLLYKITSALADLDLDIHMAIINTVLNRAQDAFYVANSEGEKIVNYELLEQVRERLLVALAPEATANMA